MGIKKLTKKFKKLIISLVTTTRSCRCNFSKNPFKIFANILEFMAGYDALQLIRTTIIYNRVIDTAGAFTNFSQIVLNFSQAFVKFFPNSMHRAVHRA